MFRRQEGSASSGRGGRRPAPACPGSGEPPRAPSDPRAPLQRPSLLPDCPVQLRTGSSVPCQDTPTARPQPWGLGPNVRSTETASTFPPNAQGGAAQGNKGLSRSWSRQALMIGWGQTGARSSGPHRLPGRPAESRASQPACRSEVREACPEEGAAELRTSHSRQELGTAQRQPGQRSRRGVCGGRAGLIEEATGPVSFPHFLQEAEC